MTQALASHQRSPESVSHLLSLLREFDSATLITRSRGGSLHGRPMSIAQVDDDVTIWFITSVASAKVEEVAEDARAMVTLQSPSRFLCLNGNAELVFDPERIRALWKEQYRVWYGSERDPDIVLVRLTTFDAEYWDRSGLQGLKTVLQAARAYVTGQPLEAKPEQSNDPESHAKIKLWVPSEPGESVEADR
ncbi:MAG TPA: pyridoxamine 5'-phosphate oxidase family protein [Polyangiaceae bacterium]